MPEAPLYKHGLALAVAAATENFVSRASHGPEACPCSNSCQEATGTVLGKLTEERWQEEDPPLQDRACAAPNTPWKVRTIHHCSSLGPDGGLVRFWLEFTFVIRYHSREFKHKADPLLQA